MLCAGAYNGAHLLGKWCPMKPMGPYGPIGCIWMHLDASGCIRMHPYASGCIRMHPYACGCTQIQRFHAGCFKLLQIWRFHAGCSKLLQIWWFHASGCIPMQSGCIPMHPFASICTISYQTCINKWSANAKQYYTQPQNNPQTNSKLPSALGFDKKKVNWETKVLNQRFLTILNDF